MVRLLLGSTYKFISSHRLKYYDAKGKVIVLLFLRATYI